MGGQDPDAPFPLAPIQHAMWVGRQEEQQLGGVSSHLYVEFDGQASTRTATRRRSQTGCTPPDAAGGDPVRRHPAHQRTRPSGHGARPSPADPAAAEAELDRIRGEKSHQMLDPDVLQNSLSLLADGRTRLHVDMDMQAADAISYRNLMADLAALYRGVDLPELGYTYREYRAS